MTTTTREDLADVIGAVTDNWDEPLDSVHDIPQIVNAILAAGYRKPRTVTTAEELDALPIGSVILDADGDIHQNVSEDAAPHFDDRPHRWNSGSGWYDSKAVLTFAPLTLLHEGAA